MIPVNSGHERKYGVYHFFIVVTSKLWIMEARFYSDFLDR